MELTFLEECRRYRDAGFQFLSLQANANQVSYLFQNGPEVLNLEQPIEEAGVRSLAQIFPLADFPERQMFRDCQIKAIGNINLVLVEDGDS